MKRVVLLLAVLTSASIVLLVVKGIDAWAERCAKERRIREWLSRSPDQPHWVINRFPRRSEWIEDGERIPNLERDLLRMTGTERDLVFRKEMVVALGYIGSSESTEAVHTLRKILATDDPFVGMAALHSLAALGDVKTVKETCANGDETVRRSACYALRRNGSEEARHILETIAVNDSNTAVRGVARNCLESWSSRKAETE